MCKTALVFSLPVLVGIICLLRAEPEASAMPDPQATESRSLDKFLTDRKIWGEDAFRVFAAIDRWRGEGESSILVFTDRVVAGTKFEAPEQAREKAARMALAMKRGPAKLSPEFATSYKAELAKKAPPLEVESARFLLDDSYRVQWKKGGAEFLKKELTMGAVANAYGPPEKTSTEVVQARGDRRPAVLTISEYAAGKIKFVQSDLSPDPNLVDHVILDVGEVAKLVLAQSR